ncbi:MAG TPA: polyprenyl synthetase family protein [Verrucomicrobiota bacterium]|nr:polyprenyl synthetase family protein [Verrucomicrobiota bacterium]
MSAFATNPEIVSDQLRQAVDKTSAWVQLIEPIVPFLENVNKRLAEQVNAFDSSITNYVAYALQSQGKQLRPVLLALSGKSIGELEDPHITAAVIVEMVHLATLVHDDVIDGAKIRRGKPTVATNWGNDITVLLGDCLFAHALKLTSGYPTTEVCRAVSSATNTVCAGEIFQTQRQWQFNFSKAEYFKAIEMKTGELFALSCELGVYLSGGNQKCRRGFREFGLALGTAYQIYDDCLDLFGTESKAGKSLGTDIAKGKLTLPIILLFETLEPVKAAELRKHLKNLDNHYFAELQNLLKQNHILEKSQEYISTFINKSKESLAPILKGAAVVNPGCISALIKLSDFLLEQTESLAAKD